MRRLLLFTLCAGILTACTGGNPGGAFNDQPSPVAPIAPAQVDRAALTALRAQLAAAVSNHVAGGHLARDWGQGVAFSLGGPYRDVDAYADLSGLLAVRASDPSPAPLAGDRDRALLASVSSEVHDLSGPHGAAYLLLSQLADETGSRACPAEGAADPRCLKAAFTDALRTGWYAGDSKSFFHVGDTVTVYRPVEAIAVGCALVVAGYDEANDDKIQAGSEIIGKEMASDFDPHFGLVYGLMSARPQGTRQATDTSTRLADQAGIAEMLLRAFDVSREQQYQAFAARVLQPLLDDRAGLRTAGGYVSGFDVKSSVLEGTAVDLEAGLLTLEAAHHYNRSDGNRFARLEEAAAQAVLAGATAAGATEGLPGALGGAHPAPARGW